MEASPLKSHCQTDPERARLCGVEVEVVHASRRFARQARRVVVVDVIHLPVEDVEDLKGDGEVLVAVSVPEPELE
jgi:hypothetical protein